MSSTSLQLSTPFSDTQAALDALAATQRSRRKTRSRGLGIAARTRCLQEWSVLNAEIVRNPSVGRFSVVLYDGSFLCLPSKWTFQSQAIVKYTYHPCSLKKYVSGSSPACVLRDRRNIAHFLDLNPCQKQTNKRGSQCINQRELGFRHSSNTSELLLSLRLLSNKQYRSSCASVFTPVLNQETGALTS